MIVVEIFTIDDCPYADEAFSLLEQAAAEMGVAIHTKRIVLKRQDECEKFQFLGSPTIRINGEDIEGRTGQVTGLCCRKYETGTGVPPRWLVEAAFVRALRPKGVLFMCVANSARSQMAEAIAKAVAPPNVAVYSAGSRPAGLNPLAVQVMAEIGLDISGHYSKGLDEVPADRIELVVTLCAEEVCPAWLGKGWRLHWALPDPASADQAEMLQKFREVRDILAFRVPRLFHLGFTPPFSSDMVQMK